MSEGEIRLLWHEASDIDRLVREYFAAHNCSVARRGNGFLDDAQVLARGVAEVLERIRKREEAQRWKRQS